MRINKDIFNNLIPYFVLLAAQLHLLRNLSLSYLAIYAVSFVVGFSYTFQRWPALGRPTQVAILLLCSIFAYPILSILPGLYLDAYRNGEEILVGISRVVFVLPMYMAVLASPKDDESLRRWLALAAIVTFFAALSIPYQFMFGGVSWFAEESERAGVVRYASLFGSLTTFGVVCGLGILAAAASIRNRLWLVICISGIIVGAALSLQKAAIVNAILCLICVPTLAGKRYSKYFGVYSGLVLALALLYYYFSEVGEYLESFRFFGSEYESSGDVSVFEGAWSRLKELPENAITYHGAQSLWFGLGPIGGSGSFGYPEVPMSHNGIVDIFLIGGIGYFILFIYFGFFVFLERGGRFGSEDKGIYLKFGFFSIGMLLINMPFSGLLIFNPSGGMFFAIATKCVLAHRRKIGSKF